MGGGEYIPLLKADVMASKAIPRIVRVPMIAERQHAPGYRVVYSEVIVLASRRPYWAMIL